MRKINTGYGRQIEIPENVNGRRIVWSQTNEIFSFTLRAGFLRIPCGTFNAKTGKVEKRMHGEPLWNIWVKEFFSKVNF